MKKQNLENPNKKKGFTCLVKHFRSNPLTAMLRSRLSRFSQTKFRCAHSYGFTLAETLITLTILGIVAAITVPGLINRQQEAANKTKVKKAMTMYEKALNQMIIENDLKTNQAIIDFGAEGGACANTTEYFKKVEGDGCRFKTADRIWWDISDIENPLIILNDKKKDETVANLQTLAKNTDDITTYGFVGKLDDEKGIVRINDKSYTPDINDSDYLTKLYGFINNNVTASDNEVDELTRLHDQYAQYDSPCADECRVGFNRYWRAYNCNGCTYQNKKGVYDKWSDIYEDENIIIDSDGNVVATNNLYIDSDGNKIGENIFNNIDKSGTSVSWDSDGNKIWEFIRNPDQSETETTWDSSGNKISESTYNSTDGSRTYTEWNSEGIKIYEEMSDPNNSNCYNYTDYIEEQSGYVCNEVLS